MKKFLAFVKESSLVEAVYDVSWGIGAETQVIAKTPNEAIKKAKAEIVRRKPKLADPKYSDTWQKKPSVHKISEAVDYPHMMYHPETGEEVKVQTPEEHNKYTKKGYTHDKPKMVEAVELDEAKLSTQQRDRLDDLILNVHLTTHPEYDGEEEPTKYLNMIRKEFGDKVAKQVKDGMEIAHWGRDNHSSGNDKLSWRKGNARITKSGKMNAQDVKALKNRIKRDKAWGGITKAVKLPEAVELDEISKKTLGSYVKKASDQLDKDWDDTKAGKPGMPNRKVTNRFDGIYKARAKGTNESVELDEAMTAAHKKLAHDVHKQLKRDEPMGLAAGMKLKADHKTLRSKYGADWRKKAGINEEVELDEAEKNDKNWEVKVKGDGYKILKHKITKKQKTVYDNGRVKEEVELDEVSASTLNSYVDKARADKSRQQKARTVAKNDYKKYGIPSDKERADAAHRKASQRNTGISMAKRKLGGYTKGTQPKVLAREEVELDEVSKALAKSYYSKAADTIGNHARSAFDSKNAAHAAKADANSNYQSFPGGMRQTTAGDRAAYNANADFHMKRAKDQERKVKNRAAGMAKASSRMEAVELDEDIKGFAKKMIAKASNSDKWHDLMRSKYGKAKWDSYWESNKNKDFWDRILDTGFNEEVELDELKQPSMLQKAKFYVSHGKTPKTMAKSEKDYAASKSSATLKDLRIGRSSDNTYKPGEKPKDDKSVKYGSPAHMQLRAIDRELKKRNEAVELDEAETMYVIKHKKTKQVLNTHSDYATAKDEHEGLGADKHKYGVYKQTKKDAALRNRNTYRESVELGELSAVTLGKYSQKARTDALDHSGGPWGKKEDPARVAKRLSGDAMAVKKLDKIRSVINKK